MTTPQTTTDIHDCPVCETILVVETGAEQKYRLVCPVCGFAAEIGPEDAAATVIEKQIDDCLLGAVPTADCPICQAEDRIGAARAAETARQENRRRRPRTGGQK